MFISSRAQADVSLPTKISITGVGVTPFSSYAHATSMINDRVTRGEKTSIVAINPEKLFAAHQDLELREILNRPEVGICDGIGAALGVLFLHGKRIPRVTGVALFQQLIEMCVREGRKAFLLGGSEEVSKEASAKLLIDYPGLKLVGRHHGYFEDSQEIVEAINRAQPDIVFVAMGSPKQELWISDYRDLTSVPVFMGVGGTLDVVSGRVARAPAFFQRTGTEWFYRLLSDPARWRRQLALPKYVWLLLRYRFGSVGH